jgi:uroporphyrinogen-III synthase
MNNPGGLHVLVTRPRPDAVALAAELERRGHSVLQQPLLEIEIDANIPLDLDGAQALLFTSANGVRAFVARSGRRDLPVYAVGDATAGEARAQEFGAVESAGGAVEDLAALVRGKAEPEGGALLHVSGSAVAGDLSGLLTSDGFAVRREQLYTARTVTRIDAAVRAALSAGTLDAVLFFSPRSATAFANLVQAAEIGDACENLTAVCLSDAVAAALAPNSWRTVTVAARPNQESLIASLEGNVTDITNDQDRDGTDSPKGGPDLLDQGNAEAVVERFGGIRPMAAKLGVPVTTVQGWKGRNQIPAGRFVTIRAAANEHGVDLAAAADDVRDDTSVDDATETKTAPETMESTESTETAETGQPTDDADGASAPPPSRGGSGSALAWVALVLAVGALGVVLYGRFGPMPPGTGPATLPSDISDRLDRLESRPPRGDLPARLGKLERRLDEASKNFAKAAVANPGDGKALAALDEQLGALRTGLDNLAGRLDGLQGTPAALDEIRKDVAALRDGMTAMSDRIKALEDRPPVSGGEIAALAIAAGQLDSAVAGGVGYRPALDRLRALAEDDAAIVKEIAILDPRAGKGVPTLTQLAAAFAEIAPKLTAAPAGAEPGWTERLRQKTLSLVKMRPIGKDGARSPVTRAERALARGDLKAAVAAVDGLTGPVAAWRGEADARLAADAALAAIRARVADLLAVEATASKSGLKSGQRTP